MITFRRVFFFDAMVKVSMIGSRIVGNPDWTRESVTTASHKMSENVRCTVESDSVRFVNFQTHLRYLYFALFHGQFCGTRIPVTDITKIDEEWLPYATTYIGDIMGASST